MEQNLLGPDLVKQTMKDVKRIRECMDSHSLEQAEKLCWSAEEAFCVTHIHGKANGITLHRKFKVGH